MKKPKITTKERLKELTKVVKDKELCESIKEKLNTKEVIK